ARHDTLTIFQLSGTGAIADPNASGSEVSGLGLGNNVFAWTVSNGPCGTTTDTMLIVLDDCLTLTIPDAFSPNGDGVNDTYVIDNLEYYPNNSIQVFNRWGSKVLDRSPYNNDWDGKSENSLNWGEQLPESTYYYVLDLGNGTDAYTGFIYLRR
ncbi:MAG: gliding motility-associated C-terminal domain-containing protein, partial [Flavobacteriales bacterium]|nr:gliding motility-associated C-terminal domain-containing protein [Flavobacteriales bacterium]